MTCTLAWILSFPQVFLLTAEFRQSFVMSGCKRVVDFQRIRSPDCGDFALTGGRSQKTEDKVIMASFALPRQ